MLHTPVQKEGSGTFYKILSGKIINDCQFNETEIGKKEGGL